MKLISALNRLAYDSPENVAVKQDCSVVTFAMLNERVARLAGWLLLQGLGPGDVVALTLRDELVHLTMSLALLRAGCTQVTLPSYEPEVMRRTLAERCRVSCHIAGSPAEGLDCVSGLVPDFEEIFGRPELERPLLPADGSGGAVLMSSSGTTGVPKLIRCTQAQIFGYGHPGIMPPAVLYRFASIESNIGKWSHLTNIARGRTLVFCDSGRMPLREICDRFGVTVVNASPSKAAGLIQSADLAGNGPAFDDIRLILGGAPVSGALRTALQQRFSSRLHVMYGATECGIVSSAGPEEHALHPDSVGRPLPGVEIEVADENGTLLPRGEVGFIRIRSRVCAVSYVDDDAATARTFRDGWFVPGDMGSMTDDGMLCFKARRDDMMILNAIKIFPSEIEAEAESFPGVRECAAFSVDSRAYGDIPLLAVVAGCGFDPQGLLAHCRERLGTRCPRKIIQIEQIPRNAMGKVVRRELQNMFGKAT